MTETSRLVHLAKRSGLRSKNEIAETLYGKRRMAKGKNPFRDFYFYLLPFAFACLLFAFCLVSAKAQSTNQNFPTPVAGNEVSGKIPARDVGDARLTNYFYVFNGTQGDVFINVTTTNLNGDIDVFTVGILRPLTKISLYAGESPTETGRVIYLRKPEKLILRIEGRTPNDNPATFRIKFAGSFEPLETTAETEAPKLPEIKPDENNNVSRQFRRHDYRNQAETDADTERNNCQSRKGSETRTRS